MLGIIIGLVLFFRAILAGFSISMIVCYCCSLQFHIFRHLAILWLLGWLRLCCWFVNLWWWHFGRIWSIVGDPGDATFVNVVVGRALVSRACEKRRQTSGGKFEDPTTRADWISPRISDPATRAETLGCVRWESSQLTWERQETKSDHFGASSKNVRNFKKGKGPSISERIPRVIVQIGQGWEASKIKYSKCWNTPCKTKHQWTYANCAIGRVKTLCKEKPPRQQPEEGMRWQTQYKKMHSVQATWQPVIKIH